MIAMTTEKLSEFDAEELARSILDIPDEAEVDEALYDAFGVDFDSWVKIVNALILLTPITVSPITRNKYHAFIKDSYSIAKVKYGERGE